MPDRPDCIHHVAECADCGGVIAIQLDRLDGIGDVTIETTGSVSFGGPATVYFGPASEPCDPQEQP